MNCPRPPVIGLISLVAALVTAPAGQARVDGPAVSPAPQATGAAWTPATLAPNRYWAATTFLPSTCEVLAYGGHSMDASGNVTVSRATLIYQPDLDRWLTYAAQKSGGPPALAHAALTFDPSHSTALLFGGSAGSLSNGTYAFEPVTRKWTTLFAPSTCTPGKCPSARQLHAQAWSNEAKAVLVFGGQGSDWAATNDLWALQGIAGRRGSLTWKWTLLQPSADPDYGMPAARSRHGMAEIPDGSDKGKMLIYGGWDAGGNTLSDTWLYDPKANSYKKLPNAGSPTPRQGFAIGLAPSLGAIIVQGGQTNGSRDPQVFKQDTWAFDHNQLEWTPLLFNAPYGNRSYHDLASDTCTGVAVVWDKPADRSGAQPTWILK